MAEAKIKKACKDLSLPLKPSATKAALGIADMVRKSPPGSAMANMRNQLGQTYEEKNLKWEGGVVPLLVQIVPLAKEKVMLEAVTFAIFNVLTESVQNVSLAAKAGAAKALSDACKDKSLLVQTYAALSIAILATDGPETRQAAVAAGAMKNLTLIAAAADTDDVIAKQGVNKQIAYTVNKRQESAATALRTLACEPPAKASAVDNGCIKTLVALMAGSTEVKTHEECAHALFLLVTDPVNRSPLIQCGGLPPLVSILDSSNSEHAKTMSAATIKELSKERPLRVPVRKARSIPALVKLCSQGKTPVAHEQASAALVELANELECKQILMEIHGLKDVAGLLKSSSEKIVLENVLSVVAFGCVIGIQNAKHEVVKTSITSFVGLQEQAAEFEVIADIVKQGKSSDESVHNMAMCALASCCLRHPLNSAKAASASGVDVIVKLLSSESDTVQANAIKALLAVCEAHGPNAKEAASLGACAVLLVHKCYSSSAEVRELSTRMLAVLGVMPSRDETSTYLMSHLVIGDAYSKQQAQVVVDDVKETLDAIRTCRDQVSKAVTAEHAHLALRLAFHDALTYRVGGGGGGANGSVVLPDELSRGENQGLEVLVEELRGIQGMHVGVGWADVVQMAAESALQDAGVVAKGSLRMLWGRSDSGVPAPEKSVPAFYRLEEEGGEGGGEGEGDGGDGGEEEGGGGPVKTRLEKSLEAAGLDLDEIAVLCASTSVGWASPPGSGVVMAGLSADYFKDAQDKVKEHKAKLKAVEDEEEGAEPPGPLSPDVAMLSDKRFDASIKKYVADEELLRADFGELFKKLSESGAVFDSRAAEGFYLG